jgi:hypothetical protein
MIYCNSAANAMITDPAARLAPTAMAAVADNMRNISTLICCAFIRSFSPALFGACYFV